LRRITIIMSTTVTYLISANYDDLGLKFYPILGQKKGVNSRFSNRGSV